MGDLEWVEVRGRNGADVVIIHGLIVGLLDKTKKLQSISALTVLNFFEPVDSVVKTALCMTTFVLIVGQSG